MQIDKSKSIRQMQAVKAWRDNGKKGTVVGPTGFGKTRCGIMVAAAESELYSTIELLDYIVLIVVPSDALRDQWKEEIESQIPFSSGIHIDTIQGITQRKKKLKVGCLITDEIHRSGANTFKELFELVEWNSVFGLTATPERADGMHVIINNYAPIVDTITIHEALKNKWISPFLNVNVGIQLDENTQIEYDKINQNFHRLFAYFNRDFNTMMACLNGEGIRVPLRPGQQKGSIWRERLAKQNGWKPENGNVRSVRFSPDWFYQVAIACNRAIADRKEILYSYEGKIHALAKILSLNPNGKFIHFSMSIDFAIKAQSFIGGAIYHSSMPTEIRLKGKKIAYAIEVIRNKKKSTMYKIVQTGKVVSWAEVKDQFPGCTRFGKDKLRLEAIQRFQSGQTNILHTVKALDEGVDVPGIDTAVITSGTSSEIQDSQRRGRSIRFVEGKVAFIFNIYIEGTQDEKWLEKRQANQRIVSCGINDISHDGTGYVIQKRLSV